MTEVLNAAPSPSRHRLLSFAIGVGGGILGILPWLVGGGVFPLQNLWATETMPEAMPFVFLPLSQYSAMLLFALVLIGGVFAGVAVLVVARRRSVAALAGREDQARDLEHGTAQRARAVAQGTVGHPGSSRFRRASGSRPAGCSVMGSARR